MNFRCAELKRRLLVCAAMGMVLPSLAQRAEPIIFSAPDTEMAVSNSAPSLVPTTRQIPDFIRSIHAPLVEASAQPLSVPFRVISPMQAAAMQQELDRQRNWTLLTPAEILGVPTMASTFGLSERNALGDKKNQTALERYFGRQQTDEKTAMTNEAAAIDAAGSWSLQGREQSDLNNGFSTPQNNSFFGAARNNRMDANQQNGTAWSSGFNSRQTTPMVQTPEQLAAAQAAAQTEADDFQKLLQPGLAARSTAAAQTTPDSLFSQPANPVGTSYTPVSSGVILPQGVTPLPSAAGSKSPSTTPVAPEWKRKLPPWMSQPGADKNF